MQSIRQQQKDYFDEQSSSVTDKSIDNNHIDTSYDNDTSDLDEETLVTEFCNFNQILKRHRRRFKRNSSHRHR